MKDPRSLWDARWDGEFDLNRMGSSDNRWITPWMDRPEIPKEGRVLDIGCGVGHDSRYLTDLEYEVVSTDLSGEALSICRQVAPPSNPVSG